MKLPIPFAGEYNERTASQISKRTAINMYPEIDGNMFIMVQRWGLALNQTVNVGPYRGGMVAYGLTFFVNNNTVYKMDATETVTSIGTINTFTGPVSMDSNGYDLVIVDGTDGFAYEFSSGTFTQITDPDFTPLNATHVRFLDGFFIVFEPGTGNFYKSTSYPTHAQLTTADDPNDGWLALDFDVAQSSPDNVTSMEVLHQQLVLFGDDTTEFWINSGNSLFPFERQPSGVMDWGILAPQSVAKGDNSIIWLAKTKEGHGHVVQATGFSPSVISNKGLEDAIADMSTKEDAYAFVHKEGSHLFYTLTFPTENKTFTYDLTTKLWHSRESYNVGRWRVGMHVHYNNMNYMGDAINGGLYRLDKDTYDDAGEPMVRTIRSDHQSENQDKLFCHEMQILCEQGVGLLTGQGSDPQIALRWSNDRGKTYGNTHNRSLGAIGEYGWRSRWTNCGAYRNRTWEASVSDPIPWTVIGAYGRFSKGLT